MKFLLTASALSLSSIAAYFSIIGLSAIFPGSIFSIITMATALELAKIIVAVWVHQNWNSISKLTKFYLTFSVLVLMAITSMGIFGFLSKSHIEHNATSAFASQELSEIDRKIKFENESIARYKEVLNQKNESIYYLDDKNDQIKENLLKDISSLTLRLDKDINDCNQKIDKARERLKFLDSEIAEIRKQKEGFFSSTSSKIKKLQEQQAQERQELHIQIKSLDDSIINYREDAKSEIKSIREKISDLGDQKVEISQEDLSFIEDQENKINTALANIEELNSRKFSLENQQLTIENELGPIKYISELIHEFGGPKFDSGTSVRMVIMMIIVVFDPLAIVMIICAFSTEKKSLDNTSNVDREFKKKRKIIPSSINLPQIKTILLKLKKLALIKLKKIPLLRKKINTL